MTPDDEWDDEEWEDDYDGVPLLDKLGVLLNLKVIGVLLVVGVLLVAALVLTGFGFYFGVGQLSLLIDVNEGVDPGDRTLDAQISATSPAFGILSHEGSYSISYEGDRQASGSFEVGDTGLDSLSIDYDDFFVGNGEYVVEIELGGKQQSDSVVLERFADSVAGRVSNFGDGDRPIDKDSPVFISLQFSAADAERDYLHPWVDMTLSIYHYENQFHEGDYTYWGDDSERGGEGAEAADWNLVGTLSVEIEGDQGSWTYSGSGASGGFSAVEIPPYNLNLELNPSNDFYGTQGSGDYTLVFEFSNQLGDDPASKSGRSDWKWFHLCDTKDDGSCKD